MVSRALRARWTPVVVGLALYFLSVAIVLYQSLRRNEGCLAYAVDDAYIHMAIARNLARHGVWGVTRFEFSSSSSSPLWTLLLAGLYRLFGASPLTPLVLNVAIGAIVLTLVGTLAEGLGAPPWQRFLAVLAAWILGPVVFAVFLGMEHLAHAAIVLLFVMAVARGATRTDRSLGLSNGAVLLLAAVLTAVRYESVIIVTVAAAALVAQRRATLAVLAVAGAGVPILTMGAVNVAHGWMFLPASVALKGLGMKAPITGGPAGLWRAFASHFEDLGHLSALIAASVALAAVWAAAGRAGARQSVAGPRLRTVCALLFAVTGIIHLSVMFGGNTAMDLRYTCYLSVLGAAVVGGIPWGPSLSLLGDWLVERARLPRRALAPVAAAAVAGIGVPVLLQAAPITRMTLGGTVKATDNIYRQQYQMGRLASELPSGTAIAVNDIGAVCYYGDIRCLDLVGLATNEIARARLRLRGQGRAAMSPVYAMVARRMHVRLAMVYDTSLDYVGHPDRSGCPWPPWHAHVPALLPQTWAPLGKWLTPRNEVCADATVCFFATDPHDQDLRDLFGRMTARLPRDMISRVFTPTMTVGRMDKGVYTP